ncbi:MAG: CDP-alcohol phosphatidyltransferase family protein [Acidimicrobiales bacterium]|nr:CDP-alcohol phosphatidyltransferase family protein [Acidimicrobiales bacterium]
MIDGRFRATFEKGLRPVGHNIRKTGIAADHLTLFGGVMAVAAAVAIGVGNLRLGFLLGVFSAVPDVLDGAVAKASGTASARGAFFDSVMDRVSDAAILGGVAVYLANSASWGGYWPLLPMAVLATTMLISYERARAESLGFDARGGLMERAERLIALGVGVLFEVLLVPILFLMLALTSVTAVQRFVKVWRQASVERPPSMWTQRRQSRRRASRRSFAERRSQRRSGALGAWRERRLGD